MFKLCFWWKPLWLRSLVRSQFSILEDDIRMIYSCPYSTSLYIWAETYKGVVIGLWYEWTHWIIFDSSQSMTALSFDIGSHSISVCPILLFYDWPVLSRAMCNMMIHIMSYHYVRQHVAVACNQAYVALQTSSIPHQQDVTPSYKSQQRDACRFV